MKALYLPAIVFLGAAAWAAPSMATTTNPNIVLVASHPNCSGNPGDPKFQMGGCGGGAAAKNKKAITPKKKKSAKHST